MPVSGSFPGRTAVVTGGSSGIGAEIARSLGGLGIAVHVLDVQPPADDNVTHRLIDIADEYAVEAAFHDIVRAEGEIAYLVSCAAIFPARPFLAVEYDQWSRVMAVNLHGAFLCVRAAVRQMREQRFGRICVFSSMLARSGGINAAAYATSKGGLLGLVRSLALEVAGENIRVNSVSPGLTDTPQPRGHLTEDQLYARGASVPLGRIGTVSDMAQAALFLLSEESSFITGQDLRPTGGSLLW